MISEVSLLFEPASQRLTMEACSQASLHEALSARAQLNHGGVPCGALLVGKRHINRCQKLLGSLLFEKAAALERRNAFPNMNKDR